MAKWGLFGAHRYLETDRGAARTARADGRPLARPWRVVSPAVAARVQRHRAARRQPAWPRLVGIACLVVAGLFAVRPVESVHPIPRHVAVTPSARPGPVPLSMRPVAPTGRVARAPDRFEWRAPASAERAAVVFLDASYAPLAEVRDVDANALATSPALRQQLETAGTFHWYVEAEVAGRVLRSRLETCEIR